MADEDVLAGQEDATQVEAAEPSLQDKLKEKIDVKVEDVGPLRKKLTVGVPKEFSTTIAPSWLPALLG